MSNPAEHGLRKRLFFHAYALVVPWAGLVVVLLLVWAGLHGLVLERYRAERAALERDHQAIRQELSHHAEARQARRDLARVLATLPVQQDFAPLALGLTEQAKSHRLRLPGLTYQVEKTDMPLVTKAILQGAATGRYEDLRMFLHNLETADELLLIENLDVDRARRGDQAITVNLRIVTYLRRTPPVAARS